MQKRYTGKWYVPINGNMQGIANPRNTKQVKNVQQIKKEGSMLSRDDLYNLIQLSSHLDGFVKHVTLYPDLFVLLVCLK